MDESLFGKLPPELRNRIFHIVLSRPSRVYIPIESYLDDHYDLNDYVHERDALNLAATCKQIRSECLPVFFAVNEFVLSSNSLDWLSPPSRDSRRRRNTRREVQALRGWIHSLGTSVEHLSEIVVFNYAWAPDDGDGTDAKMVAWIIDRFSGVFQSGNVKGVYLLHIDWTDEKPNRHEVMHLDLALPFGEKEETEALQSLDYQRRKIQDVLVDTETKEDAGEYLEVLEEAIGHVKEMLQYHGRPDLLRKTSE